MSLFRETLAFFSWIWLVLQAFVQVRFATTFAVIAAAGAARVTNMLAFILPLKVILIAGTDGIPSYFQSVVNPDQKFILIGVVSTVAILCYAASLILDAIGGKLSEAAGLEVLAGANQINIVPNQKAEARGYFARFTRICADFSFVVVCAVGLLALNWQLVGFLAILFLSFFLFTATVLGRYNETAPTALASWMTKDPGGYLRILSSVTFLSSFLVILRPFVMSNNGNILVAVLSIMIVRQMLNALVASAGDAVRLTKLKGFINPLIFPNHQVRTAEAGENRTLRQQFKKAIREEKTRSILENATGLKGSVDVIWTDSPVRGVAVFDVSFKVGNAARKFQQKVFQTRQLRLLENEEFLFSHLERRRMNAPDLVSRFSQGAFECQLCAIGEAAPVPLAKLRETRGIVVESLWQVEPPAALTAAYRASHFLLHDRITSEMLKRLDVAIDSKSEARILCEFTERLPHIKSLIADMPLSIVNPDVTMGNLFRDPVGNVLVTIWGNWMLEPLGTLFVDGYNDARLSEMIERTCEKRPGISNNLRADHLHLSQQFRSIEKAIERSAYKLALASMGKLLKNRLVRSV